MGHKARAAILLAGLFIAAPALAQPVMPGKVMADNPTGKGDPAGTTCRPPQQLPGSRLMGPEVCKTNAVWAQYRKDGMDVAPDGIHDVPSEKWRSINPQACNNAPIGSGSTSNANQTTFSPVCF